MKAKIVCKDCGKEAINDKDNSNANWMLFDLKKPCECGGRFSFQMEDKEKTLDK